MSGQRASAPPQMQGRRLAYQTFTRFAGARYCLSPAENIADVAGAPNLCMIAV